MRKDPLPFHFSKPGDGRERNSFSSRPYRRRPLRKSWEAEGWVWGGEEEAFLQKGSSSPPQSSSPAPPTRAQRDTRPRSGRAGRRRSAPHRRAGTRREPTARGGCPCSETTRARQWAKRRQDRFPTPPGFGVPARWPSRQAHGSSARRLRRFRRSGPRDPPCVTLSATES